MARINHSSNPGNRRASLSPEELEQIRRSSSWKKSEGVPSLPPKGTCLCYRFALQRRLVSSLGPVNPSLVSEGRTRMPTTCPPNTQQRQKAEPRRRWKVGWTVKVSMRSHGRNQPSSLGCPCAHVTVSYLPSIPHHLTKVFFVQEVESCN